MKAFAQKPSRTPTHLSNLPKSRPFGFQAKLRVSAPGDIYEQEADRVAARVTGMPEPRLEQACACGGGCPKCQQVSVSKRFQSKSVDANDTREIEVPAVVDALAHSPGQPLDSFTRQFMESRFGHDFSSVRVHSDRPAAESAQALNALAYTIGQDVVFGSGQFTPGTAAGRRLLAHELAHVIQQRDGVHAKDRPLLQRREIPEEDALGDDATATGELEPEEEEDLEAEEELDESERRIGETEVDVPGEMHLAQGASASQLSPGGSKKPNGPGLGATLKKWFGRRKATLKGLEECNPFGRKPRKRAPRGPGTPKKVITCVTKYDINQQQVDAGKQPEVQDQVTDRVFALSDVSCVYRVRWDMKSIPDQMIISDNDTGSIIRNTGMVRGTGQQQIQAPVNIRIRVIPNDGTLNPNNDPTVYRYDIVKICGAVRKSTTCYFAGFIPIGRKVERIPFNPRANYRKTRKRVTRAGARRLLNG